MIFDDYPPPLHHLLANPSPFGGWKTPSFAVPRSHRPVRTVVWEMDFYLASVQGSEYVWLQKNENRFGITDDWSSWNVPIISTFRGSPVLSQSHVIQQDVPTWIIWNLQGSHASLRIWCGCWPILFIFEHISMHPWIHTERTWNFCLDHHEFWANRWSDIVVLWNDTRLNYMCLPLLSSNQN